MAHHWFRGDWRTSRKVPPSGLRAASIGRVRLGSNPKVETEGVGPDKILAISFPSCEVVLWLHLS